MPLIVLETNIHAPIRRCFDFARSLDLHMISTASTHEKAVGGRLSGLIEVGETVTWRAKHLGVYQHLTVVITAMDAPYSFTDKMVSGAFKKMEHQHLFEEKNGITLMTDTFYFESPFGPVGKAFNQFYLTNYMRRFLIERNLLIKSAAEGCDYDNLIK